METTHTPEPPKRLNTLLIRDLAECYRLTGADPDGNEDWRLAQSAVKEVTRLRAEHDAAEATITALVKALAIAAELLERNGIERPEITAALTLVQP